MTQQPPSFEDVRAAHERLKGSGAVRRTPLLRNTLLDHETGAQLFLKAECLQETGSFKIRGAMNRLLQIAKADRANGVIAFSSGNHAQGIARAAKLIGVKATIVMPSDAPGVKVDGVRRDGAEIIFYDRFSESREDIAAAFAEETGATIVPSFDDPMIIAGQGTAGIETFEQAADIGEKLDHLICCTGGGGLITGIALAGSQLSPETRIWTAEPEGFDDWKRSIESGAPQSVQPGARTICDAIMTPRPGAITWEIGQKLLAGGFAVSDDQIRETMRFAFRHLKLVVEPGGAAALAAALFHLTPSMKGSNIAIVLSGGNVDAGLFAEIITAAD